MRTGDHSQQPHRRAARAPEQHIGSESLLSAIDRGNRLVVFGHVDEDGGHWTRGDSVLAKVTLLDENSAPANPRPRSSST